MTVDRTSGTQYLVAPATSTEYPTILADAHRRLKKNNEHGTWPMKKSEKQPEP